MDINIGPWLPDTPDFERQGSLEALNVTPGPSSYRPFASFAALSNALTARCQGAFFARKSDGTGVIFAGDATKLYQLSSITFSDVSRTVGGAYACPADGMWSFVQFGGYVYAFNGIDAPQQFAVDSDTNFSAMSGSPPTATYAAVVGDFVMTGNQSSARQRMQWGPINNSGSWAQSQVTMADQQDLPDGGRIQGIVGFDQSATILQEFCIRRCAFIGTPLVFQFGKIADNVGATIPGSIAAYKERIFFCDRSGFYMILWGSQIVPIGEGMVNRWFWDSNLDQTLLVRVTAAVDPVNNLYAVAFADKTNSGNLNHILLYHWPTGRWAHVQPGDMDMIWAGATQSGFTIEQLDALYGTIENMPFPWDSVVWTGVARRLISGFDTTHKLGYFSGPNLAATVDTTEAQIIPGKIAFVRSARPMVDTASATLAVGTRNRQGDSRSYGTDMAIDAYGNCKFRSRARYHVGRIKTAAGASWNHIQGIDQIQAVPFGTR
jgi:hypothetical protein